MPYAVIIYIRNNPNMLPNKKWRSLMKDRTSNGNKINAIETANKL